MEKNDGCPPITYKKFQAVLKSLGYPKRPVPTVTELADNPLAESIEERLKIPSLEDLGVVPSASETPEAKFPGGETIALERMERYLAKEVRYGRNAVMFSGIVLPRRDVNVTSLINLTWQPYGMFSFLTGVGL